MNKPSNGSDNLLCKENPFTFKSSVVDNVIQIMSLKQLSVKISDIMFDKCEYIRKKTTESEVIKEIFKRKGLDIKAFSDTFLILIVVYVAGAVTSGLKKCPNIINVFRHYQERAQETDGHHLEIDDIFSICLELRKTIKCTVLASDIPTESSSEVFYIIDDILNGVLKGVMEFFAEEIRSLAITDQLTGLYNRVFLNDQLNIEMKKNKRNPEPLSIIMFDIDHFKQVNDTYGHLVGDNVLKELGGVVKKLRGGDVGYRYGGEEFLIVLPNTDTNGAEKVAENLRKQIANLKFKSEEGEEFQITSSFGVAGYHCEEDDQISFLSKVDRALYQSKEGGRNQVTLALA